MRSLLFAAPLLLLAACSPPTQTSTPPPQLSAESQAAMDRINSADFSSIADVPAIPQPAVVPQPTTATTTPAADTTRAQPPGPAGATQTEATAPAGVQYDAAMVRIEVLLD